MTENSAMSTYFKNLNKPLLTRDEEKVIFARISNGDQKAKNELIERNLRLVIPTVKQYLRCGIPFSDLVQEGNLAIVTACDKFDPSLGNKFSTYATYWIKQRIGRYVKKHVKNVFIPEHIVNLAVQIAKAKRSLENSGIENPSTAEIVERLQILFDVKVDAKTVKSTVEACQSETSMSAKIGDDGETELGDLLVDRQTSDPASDVEYKALHNELAAAMSCLSADERKVIFVRYGIGIPSCGIEISKIADMFGIAENDVLSIIHNSVMFKTDKIAA